jgi:DNA-binding XRE family transcriptional regulator
MKTKSWKDIKDDVYGEIGTELRDDLVRDFESFKVGILLKQAREEKKITQSKLAEIINKKREFISRAERNTYPIPLCFWLLFCLCICK